MTVFDPAELLDISLSCVDREYPYFLDVAVDGPIAFARPADLHPSFFGCSDWHSAVHNHWFLMRMSRLRPDLPGVRQARKVLDDHLTPERLGRELAYFADPLNAAFSRPYGWGWVMRLHAEAASSPDSAHWERALRPLRDDLAARLDAHAGGEGLQFPIRAGTHGNTAFSLLAAIESGREIGDTAFVSRLSGAARRMFGQDRAYQTAYEPSGGDFLSPALSEAALMAAVGDPEEFAAWLTRFLPDLDGDPVLAPPVYAADASDPATVHLNGLLLIKAWSLCGIRAGLPDGDERIPVLGAAARRHFAAAAGVLTDRHYHAIHWTPTFALVASSAMAEAGLLT